ncbi:MAG: YkvA family protein [Methylophilaceae bacterium]
MFEQVKNLAKHIKQEFEVYKRISKHPNTPWLAKLFLGLAIGYLLLPFDFIPDFIPILGQLDDVVIIPLLIFIAMRLTPEWVIAQCRQNIK